VVHFFKVSLITRSDVPPSKTILSKFRVVRSVHADRFSPSRNHTSKMPYNQVPFSLLSLQALPGVIVTLIAIQRRTFLDPPNDSPTH
jgi:hypothetical protein